MNAETLKGSIRLYTADDLLEKGATCNQVDVFRALWPEGTANTLDACRLAAARGLDLDWFAERFLSVPARKIFDEASDAARKMYYEATADARKMYYEAISPAQKIFDEATDAAWKMFDAAKSDALYRAAKPEPEGAK